MTTSPEWRLLQVRLAQVQQWLRLSPFGSLSTRIGSFVIVYVCIGVLILSMMFMLGINPTLVISVVAAPLWIGVIFLAARVARFLMGRQRKETADEHETNGIGS